ncbi:MAG: hypothetical protein ACPGD5_05360 [Salibacteraceae bacterium]
MLQGITFRLTTTLLVLLYGITALAQFSYQPKRTCVTFIHNEESGWKVTDYTGTKTVASIKSENAFVQILGNEMLVYEMPVTLWNTAKNPEILEKLFTSKKTYSLVNDLNRFDQFSTFWISAANGHIRIFKKPQNIEIEDENGTKLELSNKNIGNHIFINKSKKSKISSPNNLYMIAPKGNIFEIDKSRNIWRFILTNNTLTPWSSNPPDQRLVFEIFKPEDFKTVIPVGKKNNKYWFQIIDHNNKMGLATLTTDLFQISYEVPPLFDFISPSISNDIHLVYNEEKLGVLIFSATNNNNNESRAFQTFYSPAKQSLVANGSQKQPSLLLADNKPWKSLQNKSQLITNNYFIPLYFGIKKLDEKTILYNETSTEPGIKNSGIFNFHQSQWFIPPSKSRLTSYPNATLESFLTDDSTPIKYSVYTKYGMPLYTNISDYSSHSFFHLTSQVTNLEIDSMEIIKEFKLPTFKIHTSNGWGVLQIDNTKFNILIAPHYLHIDQFGAKESLILTNENSFDWFGINYSNPNKKYELVKGSSSLNLDQNNSLIQPSSTKIAAAHADIINDNYIYCSDKKSFALKNLSEAPVISGAKIQIQNGYLWVQSYSEKSNSLYSSSLKKLKTPDFDSVFTSNSTVILINKSKQKIIPVNNSKPVIAYKIAGAYSSGKLIKSLFKLREVYFYKSSFIGLNQKNEWLILDQIGQQKTETIFNTWKEAYLSL